MNGLLIPELQFDIQRGKLSFGKFWNITRHFLGKRTFTYKEELISYEGYFDENRNPHGIGLSTYANGAVSIGSWLKGEKDGIGKSLICFLMITIRVWISKKIGEDTIVHEFKKGKILGGGLRL